MRKRDDKCKTFVDDFPESGSSAGDGLVRPALRRLRWLRPMTRAPAFPVFDLARFEAGAPAEKRALGAEVDAICRETGFLAVSSHGVPEATIRDVWTKAEAFFAQALERKLKAQAPYPGYPYGYLAPETESLARSRGVDAPPDQKESFNGGPEHAPAGMTDPEALGFCFAADDLAGRAGRVP